MGISINIKIGDKRTPDHYTYLQSWRSGQIIDIRPMGYYDKCSSSRVFNVIIDVPNINFEDLTGGKDLKYDDSLLERDWKKYLTPMDANEKYPWELGYDKEAKLVRKRDWYVDFKELLDLKIYDQSTYDAIIDLHRRHPNIVYVGDIFQLFRHEDTDQRLISHIPNQPWSTGVKTIGAAGDATDIVDAETKTAAQLTGHLTWEHLNEETTTLAKTTFDLDTNSFLLKITAQGGAEHNGGAYGNGARISFGNSDGLAFDETNAGDLANVEMSKLAFSAANNIFCVTFDDCGDNGGGLANRCLVEGGGLNVGGIADGVSGNNISIRNNIVYDADLFGISINTSDRVCHVANNSCFNCGSGFFNDHPSGSSNLIFRNNLAQDNTTDYADDGGGWGTHSKNISEDATGPDAAYDNTSLNADNFTNYAGKDFRLVSGTDVAILDDGDDLSVTFEDDIEGQTRSTWYIGASEIVGAPPGVAPTGALYGPLMGPTGGPI